MSALSPFTLGHWIDNIDAAVYTFLNSFAGNPLLDRIVREEEGNQLIKGGLFLASYWYFWFRPGPRQNERRQQIVTTVFAILAAIAVARILAVLLPFRVRPIFDPRLPHGVFAIPLQPNMENWSAFPSDMAAFFVGLAVGLLLLHRAAGVAFVLFAAIWVCVPRMYIGLHYLSDILAGAAISTLMIWRALKSNWLRNRIAPGMVLLAETRPAAFYPIAFLLSMEMANTFDSVRSLMHGAQRVLRMSPHAVMPAAAIAALAVLALSLAVHAIVWRRRAGAASTPPARSASTSAAPSRAGTAAASSTRRDATASLPRP